MSAAWSIKRLGDLSDLITKGTTPTSVGHAFVPDGINFVKIESISENGLFLVGKLAHITQDCHDALRRSQLKSGDILFSIAGALGRTAYVTEDIVPANTNQALAIIRLKKSNEVLPAFVLTALKTGIVLEQIEKVKGGVAQQNLSLAQVQGFTIPVPPLPEQKRIVRILDEAFDGIATAKANAEKNLQNGRAIFESHLQSIFTQRGQGWIEETVGDACILRSGTTLSKKLEKPAGEIPYLKVADMNISENLNGVTCSSRYVSESDVNASNLLPVGTTIFPKRGGAILTNKKRLTERVICADLNIMGVSPGKALLPKLLYFYFLNIDMRELGSGSSIPQINNYDIEPLVISFPRDMSEQARIVGQLELLSAETQRLESVYRRKAAALEALKKSLLHNAFTGNL